MDPQLLTPYPALDVLFERAHAVARQTGGRVQAYGNSVQGRPLLALHVGRGTRTVATVANVHGLECVGPLLALELALRWQHEGPHAQLIVVVSANPDAYAATFERCGTGPVSLLRKNARGVDLNRNFPRPQGRSWDHLGAGSNDPKAATYRGPAPLSEPESAALDALLGGAGVGACASLHSYMGTVIPARVTDKRAWQAYGHLCKAFCAAQPHVRYRKLASRNFDVFTGELEDHLHHHHRCWSVCVETFSVAASFRQHLRAPSTFWRFNPHEPARWIDNDVPGLLAYFAAALNLRDTL